MVVPNKALTVDSIFVSAESAVIAGLPGGVAPSVATGLGTVSSSTIISEHNWGMSFILHAPRCPSHWKLVQYIKL